jgi:hypothetical protein
MSGSQLGRLARIDLRSVWLSEAGEFTPWLAQEENLALLGDTIGLELELEAREKSVGLFRADIVCKETVTENWVLIENQLDRTDHNHLGQLLTYAAGLNAVTIVWVAERFTEEHRATLDWLNEVTDNSVNFFGLEIELWRIGDSPIAPKFNMVSKPNDWTKIVSASRRGLEEEITPTKQLQLEYWQALVEYLERHNSIVRTRKPRPQHWMNFSIGRSGFRLTALANIRERRIGIQLVIHKGNIKSWYHQLRQERVAIEAEIGEILDWREQPDNKYSDITLHNTSFNPGNRTQWPQQHAWFMQKLEAFYKSFSPRIKAVDISDYISGIPTEE